MVTSDSANSDDREAAAAGRDQLRRIRPPFLLSLTAAMVILLAGAWLSSGTMSPYAATLDSPLAYMGQSCRYLFNIDHGHFQATLWMLQGKPRSAWEFSVVLRRILYPILAFPLMSAWGFENGGFVTNLILTLSVALAFVLFVRRAIGERASIVAMWLLATYPGIAYWVGLPYSYVWIVPGSLLATMLIWKLARATSHLAILLASVALGFVFWGYDLFPFFGTAALLVLARQLRFRHLVTALLGMAIPMAVLWLFLKFMFHVPVRNSNTEPYWRIFQSFTDRIDYSSWWKLISTVPSIFVDNFFFSNFLFLPLLFVLFVLIRLIRARSVAIDTPEAEILLAALLVFLVNNLAPPYAGWQLRGLWIARLYQPVFVGFLLFVSRAVQCWWRPTEARRVLSGRIAGLLVSLTVVANGCVVFGPYLRIPIAPRVYQRFYRHSDSPDRLQANLDLYGRRPWAFCRTQPP